MTCCTFCCTLGRNHAVDFKVCFPLTVSKSPCPMLLLLLACQGAGNPFLAQAREIVYSPVQSIITKVYLVLSQFPVFTHPMENIID